MNETDQKGQFPKTRWSLVLDAQDDTPGAMADLCRAYWFPLFCYARRIRENPEDAKDLTQAFFERLLAKDMLRHARAERGRLRNFLLASLKRFAVDEWKRGQAVKRGGNVPVIELDALGERGTAALEPRNDLTPEREFDRAWARQLLTEVLGKLRALYETAGKGALFEALEDQVVSGGGARPYADLAAETGLTEPGVRYAAFTLRGRYRDLLKAAVADTVADPADVDAELRYLREVFEH